MRDVVFSYPALGRDPYNSLRTYSPHVAASITNFSRRVAETIRARVQKHAGIIRRDKRELNRLYGKFVQTKAAS